MAARTIRVPVQGMYKYAMMLGLIHEGYKLGQGARTEINVIRIGGVLMLSTPAKSTPKSSKAASKPSPARLRNRARGSPRSARKWSATRAWPSSSDWPTTRSAYGPQEPVGREAPFVYGDKAQYGESNSGGPDVAPTIHRESWKLLEEMNAVYPEP